VLAQGAKLAALFRGAGAEVGEMMSVGGACQRTTLFDEEKTGAITTACCRNGGRPTTAAQQGMSAPTRSGSEGDGECVAMGQHLP
jgi:hypothetical protein